MTEPAAVDGARTDRAWRRPDVLAARVDRSGASLVSTDVRRHNLALVTRSLLDDGPSSRSALATATGLTRGSVTALTAALLEAGVVREADDEPPAPASSRTTSPPRGRPVTLLELAADDAAILVLQLDADQAIAELTTVDDTTLARIARQHGRPMGEPEAVIDVLSTVLTAALDAAATLGRRVVDTTVVAFAPVHGEPPVVVADTDLAWGVVDVLAGLRTREPRLDPDAMLRSDAPLAAVAELRALGSPAMTEPIRDALYLKSNSGIGGAVVVDGRVVTGGRGLAGALGHLPVVPDGERCACGQLGCLVTVAGPDAILAAAGLQNTLDEAGLGRALEILVERVLRGEPDAVAAWERAAAWIARALQILSATLDPQVIVLGGYWARLAPTIEREFQLEPPNIGGFTVGTAPQVLPGSLGERAALLGAAQLARERLLADPLARLGH